MGETLRNTYLSRIDITVLFSIAMHTSETDRCRSKMHKIMWSLYEIIHFCIQFIGQFIEFISSRAVKWCEVYMK